MTTHKPDGDYKDRLSTTENEPGPNNEPDPRHHEPRFTVAKSPGIGGPPIPEDEHPFVIREQDFLAPFIIKDYLDRYRALAKPDPAVIADVEAHLEHCLAWQGANLSKVKVADR
jgi:hypothetical protein